MNARHLLLSSGMTALAAVFALACHDAAAPDGSSNDGPLTSNGAEIQWGPAPAVFPSGAELAVVQGDPSVADAVFTVRLRMPDGYILPPHWHPEDENVTVMQGTFLVGMGDAVTDQAFLPPLKTGDFITAPATMHHFAKAQGTTVVQVHGVGPFALTYVNPADDPQH